MKGKFLIMFFTVVTLLSGCNMFKDDKRLVGNIYLIKNSDDNSYHMVIYKGTINSNVLEDYVISVSGDDLLLLAKCQNENNDFVFYKVNHNKGENPIKSTAISSQEYTKLSKEIKVKYHFLDKSK